MQRIAVFVSGGGTNLQALLDAQKNNMISHGRIVLVLASNAKAYAIQRAMDNGIESVVVFRKAYGTQDEYDKAIVACMKEHDIDVIVLAGFLSILGKPVIDAYEDKILNIHPSLIPSFCGKGFYGLKVHEEALKRGVKVTGATVHLVNEIPDGGKILKQKAVYVKEGDTPETLQRRVMEEAEWKLLPEAVAELCEKLEEDI